METIYIARKAQNNAKAFITMNPANGNISVHGKFYDGCKAFSGPMLENIAAVPETLVEEIKRRDTKPLSARRPNFGISLPRFGQRPKKWNRGSSFNKHNVSRRFRSCPTALKHTLLTPKPPDFRRLFLWLLRLLPLSVHSSITSITMLPSSCGIIL